MANSLSTDVTESSQVLAELSAIFPAIDYSVLVSVFQAHSQQLEAAVDYLLGVSGPHKELENNVRSDSSLAEDMVGQFSEDIGGLPEVLPTFLDNTQQRDSDFDTEEEIGVSRSPSPDSNVNSGDDPLPTYEEACTGADRLPVAIYIPDLGGAMIESQTNVSPPGPVEGRANDKVKGESVKRKSKKKTKRKKPGKVKLVPSKIVKVKISKGKGTSVSYLSTRPGYAQLVDDAENNFYSEEEDDDEDIILLQNN